MFKIPPAVANLAPDGKLTPRQRRRLLIEMSLRKQKPGTGSSHTFMLERTAMIQGISATTCSIRKTTL
ncbi:MAG: hypothetical protein IAE79_25180 [Anaerolinea sp.]|nr:hypothetical protein [Anaerolinea sp.]